MPTPLTPRDARLAAPKEPPPLDVWRRRVIALEISSRGLVPEAAEFVTGLTPEAISAQVSRLARAVSRTPKETPA